MKSNGKKGPFSSLSVILYAGWLRPHASPDHALQLVDGICDSRHSLAAVLVKKRDPLIPHLVRRRIRHVELMPELCGGIREIKPLLRNASFVKRFARWSDSLRALTPDVGVVFFGSWLPPALFMLPKHGFLNYHPAPLPELKGFEPDTFAILEDRPCMHGTVHQVLDRYDEGAIWGVTRRVKVRKFMTPPVLLHELADAGISSVVRSLDRMASGYRPAMLSAGSGSMATRKRAKAEAIIQWEKDTLRKINCRLRAFNSQDIGFFLIAHLDGRALVVRNVEGYPGVFPGRPGEVLGRYQGLGCYHNAPIVRAVDGIVLLCEAGPDCVMTGGNLIPGGRPRRLTVRAEVLRALKK